MSRRHQPSGLTEGLSCLIDPHWSVDQALAVIELLDDLRDLIWSHYEIPLTQRIRDERVTSTDRCDCEDPPF